MCFLHQERERFKYMVTLSLLRNNFLGKSFIFHPATWDNLWEIYIPEHSFLHILFLSAHGKNKHELFLLCCISSFGFGIYMGVGT